MTDTTAFTVDASILDMLQTSIGDRLRVDPRSQTLVTHLDTFDWRLWRGGSRLSAETTGGRRTLRWIQHDTAPYVLPFPGNVRFVRDLPAGFLHSTLEPVVGVRALLPVGVTMPTPVMATRRFVLMRWSPVSGRRGSRRCVCPRRGFAPSPSGSAGRIPQAALRV